MRIIAIPKFDQVAAALSSADVGVKPADRKRQFDKLKKGRQAKSHHGSRTATYAADSVLTEHNVIASAREETVLTGAFLVEGNADTLAALQKDLPDFHVVEDYEIPLTHQAGQAQADGCSQKP